MSDKFPKTYLNSLRDCTLREDNFRYRFRRQWTYVKTDWVLSWWSKAELVKRCGVRSFLRVTALQHAEETLLFSRLKRLWLQQKQLKKRSDISLSGSLFDKFLCPDDTWNRAFTFTSKRKEHKFMTLKTENLKPSLKKNNIHKTLFKF